MRLLNNRLCLNFKLLRRPTNTFIFFFWLSLLSCFSSLSLCSLTRFFVNSSLGDEEMTVQSFALCDVALFPHVPHRSTCMFECGYLINQHTRVFDHATCHTKKKNLISRSNEESPKQKILRTAISPTCASSRFRRLHSSFMLRLISINCDFTV